jgi:hypothetical protein
MQTEVIRPRLPLLFEPISIPDVSKPGKRWDSEKTESNADWNIEIKKPLNELKEEIFPASEFLEKHSNQSKYPNPKEIQLGIEDVPAKPKPVQKETNTVGSIRKKPVELEIFQSKFGLSEVTPSRPIHSRKPSLFRPSGHLNEKEPEDLESNLKSIHNLTSYQRFNQNIEKEEEVNNLMEFTGQYASVQQRPDNNNLPKKSNLTPTEARIVSEKPENEGGRHARQLKNPGSTVVPDSFRDIKTKAEVEQPVIRVNIGRIEVKAVTQIPLSQKRENKPQAQKLSLDSYLNSRKEGKI